MTTFYDRVSLMMNLLFVWESINAMKKRFKSISHRFSTSSASSYTSTDRKMKNAKQSINMASLLRIYDVFIPSPSVFCLRSRYNFPYLAF